MDAANARLLLNATEMVPLFRHMPALRAHSVEGAELRALWVKPGHHFNAHYRLTVAGESSTPLLASAFLLDAGRDAQVIRALGEHRPRDAAANCPHCNSYLVRPGVLVQLFPLDYRLPTLPACLDARRVGHSLARGLDLTASEPAGYRPGMRCQIRYWNARGTTCYGKVAVEKEPGRIFALHERVHAALERARSRCRVAEPLGYVAELHLTVMAAAPGTTFHDALRGGRDLDTEVRAIARALADLHHLMVDGVDRLYDVADELELVQAWVRAVSEILPDGASVLRASEARLLKHQPTAGNAGAIVHRDFYDKQVLLSPSGQTFLDMDTTCRGDPELDLGNFCAELQLRGMQFEQAERCLALGQAFLRSYPGRFDADRVEWYRQSSLLRLACGYTLRPRWRHRALELIAAGGRP